MSDDRLEISFGCLFSKRIQFLSNADFWCLNTPPKNY